VFRLLEAFALIIVPKMCWIAAVITALDGLGPEARALAMIALSLDGMLLLRAVSQSTDSVAGDS
jgi:hypothetical protein